MSTVAQHPFALERFADFARRYAEAAKEPTVKVVTELATELNTAVAEAAAQHDFRLMAALASRISRLRRTMSARQEAAVGQTTAVSYLSLMLDTLETARAVALAEHLSARDQAEVVKLKDKVLWLILDGHGRPTAIADKLGVDPVQVSRALRELVDEGRAEKASPPAEYARDKRVRWYRAVESPRSASDVTVADAGGTVAVTIHGGLRILAVLRDDGCLVAVDRAGQAADKTSRKNLAAALTSA
jgi:hypothetical protein